MSLTRIDCFVHRGAAAGLDSSSFVVVNPRRRPASVVVACSGAVAHRLGSQVAYKLALEHFVDGVLDFYEGRGAEVAAHAVGAPAVAASVTEPSEVSVEVLEAAFKRANRSVYEFGHKLAAGGRLAASLLGVVIEEEIVAAGRVARGAAYLVRSGEVFPFFDRGVGSVQEKDCVGANAMVEVELASIPLQESDCVIALSEVLSVEHEKQLPLLVSRAEAGQDLAAHLVSGLALPTEPAFTLVARIGPRAVYLEEVVDES